jgi:hypothetical protein
MISGMVIEQHTSSSMPTRIARQERQQRAQICIEESSKAPRPGLRAQWLALVTAAERVFQMESGLPS